MSDPFERNGATPGQMPPANALPPRRPRPFEGTPASVLWLTGLIAVSHLARIALPIESQNEVYLHLALVPSFLTTGNTPYLSGFDRILPFVGYPFLHGGFLHLIFNSIALLDLGGNVARTQGTRNFLIVFFASAIGGAIAFVLINPGMDGPMVGSSGAVCGLFGAYAGEALLRARGIWSEMRRKLVWRAMFWFLLINVGLMALLRFADVFPIAWEAHLGGFLVGTALAPFTMKRHR